MEKVNLKLASGKLGKISSKKETILLVTEVFLGIVTHLVSVSSIKIPTIFVSYLRIKGSPAIIDNYANGTIIAANFLISSIDISLGFNLFLISVK